MSKSRTPKYKVGDLVSWVPIWGRPVDIAAKITEISKEHYHYIFIRHDRKSCLGKTSSFSFQGLEEATQLIPSPSKVWADLNND